MKNENDDLRKEIKSLSKIIEENERYIRREKNEHHDTENKLRSEKLKVREACERNVFMEKKV